ncbi:Imm63 family immunity protein [Lutispora saccharofermentans]|uniref:Immunity 63 family protein n=1 Tax=Lutispora saccharofermentans TaxID=3024236 RepID=A0ABT1NPD9_9FIRM|nr:Imm63 family immunity protein [Lutispora saccharofermentans]MCQ1531826.1 immunity 63 family protein [Lutispora saccharofermentans]
MDSDNLYTTIELEKNLNATYERLKPLAISESIYKPLDIYFSTGTPQNMEGAYCYSDENGYHYCYTERGKVSMHKITKDFFELSYWIINDQVFNMALSYELKHRIKGKDPRRLIFNKELQLFESIGENYKKRAENEINNILNRAPYQDQLFL